MVITQEPAQSLAALHRPLTTNVRFPREQPDIALPLVISLQVPRHFTRRYVEYTSGVLSSPTESVFLVPRMSAWRRNAIRRPLTRMPDEEIIYRFQLSRTLPAGTDIASMIALNRLLYERVRDMGGYRMTSSAVPMSQDDWKRHYGPTWQSVQAAKTKFDPKNVLTPGHGMFPG